MKKQQSNLFKPGNSKSLSLFVFFLGGFFYLYEYCLQVSPGIMHDDIMRVLHINAGMLGSVTGIYYIAYPLMQIPAGVLFDFFGARKVLSLAITVCALGALIFGSVHTISGMMLGRFLMGGASAFAFVGALYIALHWFQSRYFAILAGIVQLLGSLGAFFAEAPLAKAVGEYGWVTMLWVLSSVGFLLALCVWFFIKDAPEKKKARDEGKIKWKDIFSNFKIILKNSQTWILGIYCFCIWAPVSAFGVLWGVPFLMEKYGMSTVMAASTCSMIWLGIATGSPFIGWWSNRLNLRRPPLALFPFIGLCVLSVVIYTPHLPLLWLYTLLFFVGVAAAGQSLTFAVVSEINKKNFVSTAIGFNNMVLVSCGTIFQPLIGHLLDIHWDGKIAHGVHVYSTSNFEFAMISLPICFLISTLIGAFLIRETHAVHI